MRVPSLKLPKPQKVASAVTGKLKNLQKAAVKLEKGAQQGLQQVARKSEAAVGKLHKAAQQTQVMKKQAQDTFSSGKKALDGLGEQWQKLTKKPLETFNRLSDAEKRFLSTNLHLARPFSDAADKADALSARYAGAQLKGKDQNIYGDNAANALRHATWNALMVKRAHDNPVGGGNLEAAAKKAYEFATAHEDNPKNTIEINKKMDLHNNSVGRNVALQVLRENPKASDEELFQAVAAAFKQGKLREVSGSSLSVAK
jgi:thymidylate synthase ThyX